MRIEHVAIWTRDLERLRAFYETHFDARSGARYASARQPGFYSYFLEFPAGGARVELMSIPELAEGEPGVSVIGYAHLAVSVGSRAAVDALLAQLRAAGVPVVSEARLTGDGYYEAVVMDPDANRIEITA